MATTAEPRPVMLGVRCTGDLVECVLQRIAVTDRNGNARIACQLIINDKTVPRSLGSLLRQRRQNVTHGCFLKLKSLNAVAHRKEVQSRRSCHRQTACHGNAENDARLALSGRDEKDNCRDCAEHPPDGTFQTRLKPGKRPRPRGQHTQQHEQDVDHMRPSQVLFQSCQAV
jgi:hypothetical protein